MTSPRLSLVIPCFREREALPDLVGRCAALTREADCEVILVENGSLDGSADLLTRLRAPHARVRAVMLAENAGYGGGILAGLRAARGAILGWTHADGQTDPADALRALPLFDASPTAFVKGRRSGRPPLDRAFTAGMSALEFALLGVRMWDINAQPTLFPRGFYAGWTAPPDDFSLDLFAFCSARQQARPVLRLPVAFPPRRTGDGNHDTLAGRLRTARRTAAYSVLLRRRLRSAR